MFLTMLVDIAALGRNSQAILRLSSCLPDGTHYLKCQTGAPHWNTKMCFPRKLRIWTDHMGECWGTLKKCPHFLLLLHCWAFWKDLSVLLQRLWSLFGVWIVCVSPVEWFLLWVSVKLWGVNRLLEEPSHQVEGVRFWFLAVVQVYFISVSSLHLRTFTWARNSSCPFCNLFWGHRHYQ